MVKVTQLKKLLAANKYTAKQYQILEVDDSLEVRSDNVALIFFLAGNTSKNELQLTPALVIRIYQV